MKLLALSALALLLPSNGVSSGSGGARVQVVAKEYSFTLSRLRVKSGTVAFELANFGEDPHDLRLQRRGARHVTGSSEVAPGELTRLAVRLPAGRYSLWCSVGDHRKRGMSATLVVTR